MDAAWLEKTTKDFVNSLIASKTRHTLCLSIAEPGFKAEEVVKVHLEGKQPIEVVAEPDDAQFREAAGKLGGGKVTLMTFSDLDLKPKVVAALLEHVKKPDPGGKLVVVAKTWSGDNTELRKGCLFYQQNLPKPPKEGK